MANTVQLTNNGQPVFPVTDESLVMGLNYRPYDSENPDGMGYLVLKKNKTFAEQVTEANTIYEIRYEFDLGGDEVTIPSGCVLKFDGGLISNGEIEGDKTEITATAKKIFNNIIFSGDFLVGKMFPQWFGAVADGDADNTDSFQDALDSIGVLSDTIEILPGRYRFNSSLTIWKSNTTILCNGDVKLNYYGTSHFFIIDLTDGVSHYNAAKGRFFGGVLRAFDEECGDIFHIIYAPEFRFEKISTLYGENGFNTYFSNFAGIWYTYFVECRANWAKKNGFNIRPISGAGQVNQVSFYRCTAGSCGNPIYGQRTNIPDEVDGNGFDIGGSAISLLSCAPESNNGCGIKVRKDVYTATGIVIIDIYSEGNLMPPIYIGKGKNILVAGLYDKNNQEAVGAFSQYYANDYNIQIEGNIIRKQLGLVTLNESMYSFSEPYRDTQSKLTGIKLPANVRYRLRANTGASFLVVSLYIVVSGHLLQVGTELRANYNNAEAKTITDISDDTVTFDSALASNRTRIQLVSQAHPLYSLGATTLKSYPIPVRDLQVYGGFAGAAIYSVSTSAGATTFQLTNAMKNNHPDLKVGDVVYFFSSPDYTTLHTIGVTNTNERNAAIPLPTTLEGHPMAKCFCLGFTTNMQEDVVAFDFFGAYPG